MSGVESKTQTQIFTGEPVYTVASLGDIDYLITEDRKVNYINEHWPKHSYIVM